MATKTNPEFPQLDIADLVSTRNLLHEFAKVLGSWLKANRTKRKHWWHASLRPTLNGFGTQVIHANIDFELELNLRNSTLCIQTADGNHLNEALNDHNVDTLANTIDAFLTSAGLASEHVPERVATASTANGTYSEEQARKMWQAVTGVAATMEKFRAATREECSPIQLWPHHFDLSLLWLPGGLVDGQDPMDEENADQQMNFGFVFGDETIPEPYFYVTAYPFPENFQKNALPPGTQWHSQGFNAAVLAYATLQKNSDSQQYLLGLWTLLQEAGRKSFGGLKLSQ